MDMASMTTTMAMAMSSTASSSMASSTSMDMDMDSSSTMTSADMMMVFFQSVTTPLYSMNWMPTRPGAYAGTCIFLILLATIHCILQSVRGILASSVWASPNLIGAEGKLSTFDGDVGLPDRTVAAALSTGLRSHPFRIATEASRAIFEVFISGIGYLLMLAVMTMNVGYFLSVLGGIFLGTFLAGRFGSGGSHH